MITITKFLFVAVITLTTFSCSRTRDALGLDGMYNAVRAGQWASVNKKTGSSTSVDVELVPQGGYAKFLETKIHFYDKDENQEPTKSMSYSFKDTKTIVLDGADYKIRENFAASMKTMTAVSVDGNTTYTFKRDK